MKTKIAMRIGIFAKFLAVGCMAMLLSACSDDPTDDVLAADGDLTPEMIWGEKGLMWSEAHKVTYRSDDVPDEMKTGYMIIKYMMQPRNFFGKKYLEVFVRNHHNFIIPEHEEYLRLSGNKVYGLDVTTGEEILFHDFSTWTDGGTITIGSLDPAACLSVPVVRFAALPFGGALPYAVYGKDGATDYVRFIGEISGRGLTNYMSSVRGGAKFAGGEVSEESIVLEIYSPAVFKTVFRHPDYDAIMSQELPFVPEGI